MIDSALAHRIRVVGLDVDGVLTDGGIYLGDVAGARVELKRFEIQDGFGIMMLRQAGILPVIVTGRVSESVAHRARELGIGDVIQDPGARKLPAFRRLLDRCSISLDEAAFVGDDIPDLAILRCVALPVVVANASREAREAARVRLTRTGGAGAIREFAELLLRARGEWDAQVARYVAERSGQTAGITG
jgi:3-deoxy-D-manno-octulosonate 8-phosphate phosphatase (KDO 8-P phosphatase)